MATFLEYLRTKPVPDLVVRSAGAPGSGQRQATRSSVYAITRIIRYFIWIVGTIIGLDYIGFDLARFALIGGAVCVGIGFGLQNIFSNFVSGIIILLEKTLKVGDFVDLQSGDLT